MFKYLLNLFVNTKISDDIVLFTFFICCLCTFLPFFLGTTTQI